MVSINSEFGLRNAEGEKRCQGRPKVDPSRLSQNPDAARMRKRREASSLGGKASAERRARLAEDGFKQPNGRPHDGIQDTCGFSDPPLEHWAHEICQGTAWFWAKRGKVEPPASRLPQWDTAQKFWISDAVASGTSLLDGRRTPTRSGDWA